MVMENSRLPFWYWYITINLMTDTKIGFLTLEPHNWALTTINLSEK